MGFFTNMGNMLNGTWALFGSLFMMMLGNGLQNTLLGVRGNDEGFSTFSLSIIATSYYAGYFLGSFIVPRYIKQVGYIRVFATLVAFASVAAIVYAMYVNTYIWFAMRFLTGLCFAGLYMVAESWLNTQTNNENRAQVLAVYVIVLYLGLAGGQMFLGWGDVNGYYLFALASVIISVAAVPLLLTTRPSPHIPETSNMSIKKLYQRSPLGVVSTFLANFLVGASVGLAAIYGTSIGMENKSIALLISLSYIGCILFQFPVGYISDKIDRRKVLIILTVISASICFFAATQDSHKVIIFCFFLFGGFAFPLYSTCIAHVNDRLDPEEILPATSALLIIGGFGSMFAPMFVGFIMAKFGPQWFFWIIGISCSLITLFAVYRMTQSTVIDIDEMSDYSPVGLGVTASTINLATEDIQLELDFEYSSQLQTEEIEETESTKEIN